MDVQRFRKIPPYFKNHLQPTAKLPKIAQSVYNIAYYEHVFIRFDLAKSHQKIRTKLILEILLGNIIPAGNYMFKVNNGNTRAKCEICSNLTIRTDWVD